MRERRYWLDFYGVCPAILVDHGILDLWLAAATYSLPFFIPRGGQPPMGDCFTNFPFGLTLEGQYIIKNLVLVAAGLVIGSTVRGGYIDPEPER